MSFSNPLYDITRLFSLPNIKVAVLKQEKWFSLSLMANQIGEGILPYPEHRNLKDKIWGKDFRGRCGRKCTRIDETDRVASYPPKDYLFRVKKLDGFLQIIKLMVQRYSPRKYAIILRPVYTSLFKGRMH